MAEEKNKNLQEDFEPAYTESSDDTAMLGGAAIRTCSKYRTGIGVSPANFDGTED